MILRIDGDNLILIKEEYIEDEDLFVELNPEFIKVDTLEYSISGFYKYDGASIVTNPEKDLIELQNQKMQEVQDKFNDLMYEGTFESSLGFTADNRRGGGKDDKDNVSSLIDLGQEPVYFKDSDNQFQALTTADLQTLKQEMIQDGLGKYQWKWSKETEIMSTTLIVDLNSIEI